MEAPLTTDGRGVQHGLYAKSEKALKARNQGIGDVLNAPIGPTPRMVRESKITNDSPNRLSSSSRHFESTSTEAPRPPLAAPSAELRVLEESGRLQSSSRDRQSSAMKRLTRREL